MNLSKIIKNAGLFLLFAGVTAAVGATLNFLLADDVHSYTRIMLEELYGSTTNIDTLFVGSSHCYRSFDPALADSLLEENTFNAGSSQQLPDGSYHMLVEAEKENHLKTVYLETFFTGYLQASSKNVPLACFLLTDYMRPSYNKYSYLFEMGGLPALAESLLPAKYTIASPEKLPALWKAKLTDGYAKGNYGYVTYPGTEEYRGKGFVYTWGTPPYGFDAIAAVDAEQPISDFGQTYLDKTVAFCQQNEIRLVLVTAPLPSAFAANTQNYQAYVYAMQAFAQKNDIEYWDFTLYRNTAELVLGEQDFSDAHHLNGQGAEKFTTVFCHVAKAAQAGENVSNFFYDTLAEKLAQAPDGTDIQRKETAK